MVHTISRSPKPKLRDEDYYEFNLDEGGPKYRLPLLKFLPPGLALRLSASDPSGIVKLFDKYCPEALDSLEDEKELGEIFKGWQAASGISVGESSASASS